MWKLIYIYILIIWWIENSKEQYLFQIVYNIIHGLAVIFHQFIAYLLNKKYEFIKISKVFIYILLQNIYWVQ